MPATPDHIELAGDPPVSLHVRRRAQSRRMSLSVSRLDGKVTLTLPARASLRSAMAFVAERRAWLDQALSGLQAVRVVGPGTLLPIEGVAHAVQAAALRGARIEGGALLVPAARPAAGAQALLRLMARQRLAARVAVHAEALGRTAGSLTLRDTRSRWGSCTAKGDLMFNWRLIMAPPEVLDYVAAHEVAHLAQMNHSPAFWAEVARLFPGHLEARRWLKTHGATLHGYRFA